VALDHRVATLSQTRETSRRTEIALKVPKACCSAERKPVSVGTTASSRIVWPGCGTISSTSQSDTWRRSNRRSSAALTRLGEGL